MKTLQDVTEAIIAGLRGGLEIQLDPGTAARLDRIEELIYKLNATIEGKTQYIKGDRAAARVAGFSCKTAFRKWAREQGIEPDRRGGLNFWDKSKLERR